MFSLFICYMYLPIRDILNIIPILVVASILYAARYLSDYVCTLFLLLYVSFI